MRCPARSNAGPAAWLLLLVAGCAIGTLLYVVPTSISL